MKIFFIHICYLELTLYFGHKVFVSLKNSSTFSHSIFLSENMGMIQSKQQQWERFNNNNNSNNVITFRTYTLRNILVTD
jgi:hypothetical protein